MKQHSGFTLIEYVLYIGISAVVLVALLRGTLLIFSSRDSLAVLQPTQEELRFAVRRLTRTLRNAVSVDASASVFQSDSGVLSLTMSDAVLSPTVFALQNGTLMVTEGASTPLAITSPRIVVEQLRFLNLTAAGPAGTVKITLRARSATASQTLSVETTVSLRQ